MSGTLFVLAIVAWFVVKVLRSMGSMGPVSGPRRKESMTRDEARRRLQAALESLQQPGAARTITVPADKTAVAKRRPPRRGEDTSRPEVETDLDDEAERVIQQRRREVERRNQALAGDDHEVFDQQVRPAAPVPAAAPRPAPSSRLRDAIIWQEILGPPVSER
jgi:hypothetical protein